MVAEGPNMNLGIITHDNELVVSHINHAADELAMWVGQSPTLQGCCVACVRCVAVSHEYTNTDLTQCHWLPDTPL